MRQIKLNRRTSHPISRLLRPILEMKRFRAAMGGFFSMSTLLSGVFLWPNDQLAMASSTAIQPFNEVVVMETKRSLVNVVPENTGVSQNFHVGHPGMDITAPLGSKIYPLKDGQVVLVSATKWDYGRAVVIDHGQGMKTRYAHMGKIFVQEGEKVSTEIVIGEIGLTGRTTGPHLHIEVLVSGKAVNPRPYLSLEKER